VPSFKVGRTKGAGLLFLQNIQDNHWTESPPSPILEFEKVGGDDAIRKLIFLTGTRSSRTWEQQVWCTYGPFRHGDRNSLEDP